MGGGQPSLPPPPASPAGLRPATRSSSAPNPEGGAPDRGNRSTRGEPFLPSAPAACGSGAPIFPLLDRARTGDSEALADLLLATRPLLLRAVAGKLRGGWARGWREDLVQEALLDVLRAHPTCAAESERELRAWVAAIARRRIADFYRSEGTRHAVTVPLSDCGPVPDADPAASLPPDASAQALRQAMDRLPESAQRLLWARLVRSASWAEAGIELDIPGTAAKRRFQRITARLRRTLGPRNVHAT